MGGAGARANHCRKPRFLLLPPRIDPPPTAAPLPSVLHTRRPPHRNRPLATRRPRRRKVPGPPPPPSGPRAIYNTVRITLRREFAYCARIYTYAHIITYYTRIQCASIGYVHVCTKRTLPLKKNNIYRAYEVSVMGRGGE